MLSEVWVSNFRSLDNFHLKIEPGLNVLVGPNGAGKTSVIKWFEFLSLLANYSLRESIGKIGGANHVFRRKGDKYADELFFSIKGDTEVDFGIYSSESSGSIFQIHYEYNGTISVVKNQIFFSKQDTKVRISKNQ